MRLKPLNPLKAFKSLFLASIFAILGPSFCLAGDIIANEFGGLNTQDPPVSIQPFQSQDLLNVNLQPGMKAVIKRDGYGLFQTLTSVSTSAVHGAYHFQQTGGGDVQLWGADQYLYGVVNDAAAVALATGTVNSTWQCTDNLGFAYCLDGTAGDTAVKTDGSKANTTFQGGIPLGTTITSTPLQLVVAGVSGSLSTLNISANNNFTNFTTGPLPTDPYTEIINAPGSRITHVAYYFGKIFWWKDQSFGYLTGSASQNTVTITIVSNQIGTLDNSSAFWNPTVYDGPNAFATGAQTVSSGNPYFNEAGTLGGIFFRGQDNHVYQYDGYTLTRLSRIISPTVTAANRKKANSWTQTSQADFGGGITVPNVNLSTSASAGDVIVSSFQAQENTSTQWNLGSNSNFTISSSSMQLTTNNSGTGPSDASFETCADPVGNTAPATGWTSTGGGFGNCTGTFTTRGGCVMTAQSGSNFMAPNSGLGLFACSTVPTITADILSFANNAVLASDSFSMPDTSCAWTSRTITAGASNIGKRVYVRFTANSASGGGCTQGVSYSTNTTSTFILGGDISYKFMGAIYHSGANFEFTPAFDNITNGSSTITTGSFTSQVYDTGFNSSMFQFQGFSYTANSSTPTFDVKTATANFAQSTWTELLTTTGTNAFGNRYVRYTSTITVGASDSALTSISSITVISRSTGTYYSAVNQAANLTTWGNFIADDVLPGISSITYYTRSSTSSFLSTAPGLPTWVLQTKNATVAASTGTYMQMRADFAVTAATETPTLNDFTFNWTEGSAGDKAYIGYFQDAIWFSVSSGSSTSTNNTILYLDLINNAWLKYNIIANGFLVENNALYFGDPTSGKVYKFGSVTTDNGLAINSYWKSKDFTGDDPTVQNEFQQSDFIFNSVVSTITYTYNLDQRVSTSVSLPLYGGSSSLIKRGILLSPGKIGTFYNFQVGDNSSNAAWKFMGHRVHYNKLNWIPQTK